MASDMQGDKESYSPWEKPDESLDMGQYQVFGNVGSGTNFFLTIL